MTMIYDLSEAELLAMYRENFAKLDFLMNELLPSLFWGETLAGWRRDKKEVTLMRAETDYTLKRAWYPQGLVNLARDELASRNPAKWSNLPTQVEVKLAPYQRPEMYEILKGIQHGV